MTEPIYLDNNATTRPFDDVLEAMNRAARDHYANPSSVHTLGQRARHKIEIAREQVAGLLHAPPQRVVFTSGGTESVNLAIRGVLANRSRPGHLVTSTVEHSASRAVCDWAREQGHEVAEISVDGAGRLDLDELRETLRQDTSLVALLWANNETGVIFDVEAVARLCAERGVPLHLDAVQAAGKLHIDVSRLPVDFLSIAAHKFHGPRGAGALYIAPNRKIRPLIVGGNQESQRRGGTENLPGIVGMGAAAEIVARWGEQEQRKIVCLRDRLEAGLCHALAPAIVNGSPAPRVANTTNISFDGLEAEGMLILLSENGICASSGSACTSGSLEPSHVLQAMKVGESRLAGAIRFSLSHFNTEAEIERVIETVPKLLTALPRQAGQLRSDS